MLRRLLQPPEVQEPCRSVQTECWSGPKTMGRTMMHSGPLKGQAVGDSSGEDMWQEEREERNGCHDGSRRTLAFVSCNVQ